MRTALFLAIAFLAMPAVAQQREPATPPAPSIPAETEQSTRTPPERQSLMGAVMGLLIESAEQTSADQARQHRAQESKVEAGSLNARSAQSRETPARETRGEVALHSGSPGTP